MLITKTVILKWRLNNKEYYEAKGYKFTKVGEKFEVDVEDLTFGSHYIVEVKCDNCLTINNIPWKGFISRKYYDGYLCIKCIKKFSKEKMIKSKILNGKSFEQWCIENDRQDVLDRWDYELNEKKPNEITYGSNKEIYIKCPNNLHQSESKSITRFTSGQHNGVMDCNQCNSFEQWCLNNNRQDVLNRWDYELNNCKPNEISYGTKSKYWFKCPRGIHESELKNINGFTNGQDGSIRCNKCNSFAQWGIDNQGEEFLEKYWDYKKNTIDPLKISHCSRTKVWIKCQEKKYHPSYQTSCNNFVNGNKCPYCASIKTHPFDSFAQWGIDNLGEDFLEKYWDWENNNELDIDPWTLSKSSTIKVWMKCQMKDYHIYDISCANFYTGWRCPYCTNKKVHSLDSLGKLLEDSNSLNVWSDKNKQTPYEIAPMSNKKFWWKCPDDKHEDYYRTALDSNTCHYRCPECGFSKGETKISEYMLNNDIEYIPQKEFDGLIGTGGGSLSFDYYLPQYNLLIEYQGQQHEKYILGFHKSEDDFEKQLEHDRRKREYAKEHNIKLLEVWYWDYDNIDNILSKNIC